jgi:hypothetical protein
VARRNIYHPCSDQEHWQQDGISSKLIYGCEETDITSIDSNSAILLETIKKGETVEADFKITIGCYGGNRQFFITLVSQRAPEESIISREVLS